MTRGASRERPFLVVDTATRRAVLALGTASGTLIAERSWVAGYRHGEELLAHIDGLLAGQALDADALGGLVVGTGPGAFTGLRVGLATVKGLAYALGLPVAGVPTGEALLAAARGASLPAATGALPAPAAGASRSPAAGAPPPPVRERTLAIVLLQPAGPSDLVLTRPGSRPRIVPGGTEPDIGPGERVVAVDLDGRADAAALALGEAALAGLGAALLRAGGRRLAAGDADDLATLVPEYVTLPRGVRTAVPETAVEVSGAAGAGEAGRVAGSRGAS